MQSVIRSIPIPRISLSRILRYIEYLCEKGEVKCIDLKNHGLDFGRGVGDITRFLRNIGVVQVENDLAKLSSREICSLLRSKILVKVYMHNLLYERLLQYRLIFDIVRRHGSVRLEELHVKVNEELSKICPNAWINNVAFKTLIGFLEDLDLACRKGNVVVYTGKVFSQVERCIEESSRSLGETKILDVTLLAECLDIDAKILEDLLSGLLVDYKAPGRTYKKIDVNVDIVSTLLSRGLMMRTSSTDK